MKALIFILSVVLTGSSVFATEDTTNNFDLQNKLKSNEGQEFQATFNSKRFLAWTAQEERFLSHRTLDKLANNRAGDICQYFGFSKTKFSPITEKMTKAPGETEYIVNYIQNGKLTVINAGEGFMSHVLIPTVFTKITCYL
jgi:hypothetical protein